MKRNTPENWGFKTAKSISEPLPKLHARWWNPYAEMKKYKSYCSYCGCPLTITKDDPLGLECCKCQD